MKEDRTAEDLLFQVMPELGALLSAPIERLELAGAEVFNVDSGYILACFEKNISEETVEAMAHLAPVYAVFRDASFGEDSTLTNMGEIFKTYSPDTEVRVL